MPSTKASADVLSTTLFHYASQRFQDSAHYPDDGHPITATRLARNMSQLYVQVQDVQHRIIYPYANARAGEHSLASTGQKSGLWKNLGRPPQQTAGVGFIAEGFETSRPYRRMPGSDHRTVAWITAGIEGAPALQRGRWLRARRRAARRALDCRGNTMALTGAAWPGVKSQRVIAAAPRSDHAPQRREGGPAMTAEDQETADRAAALRPLTAAELAWITASVAGVLARQPAATAAVGFDDPPDGLLALLRSP